MDIFIGILTAVEVIVCLLLILVVLMQRPRQEGLGASFGDAAASQVWGAQTTNVLQKFTVYLAITLFALTILLAVLVSRHQTGGKSTKIFGDAKPGAAAPVAAPSTEEKAKAEIMEKIQQAVKAEQAKSGEPAKDAAPVETPKSNSAETPAPAAKADSATPAPAPAPAPATAPAPAAATPAPAPATTPAPADQPK